MKTNTASMNQKKPLSKGLFKMFTCNSGKNIKSLDNLNLKESSLNINIENLKNEKFNTNFLFFLWKRGIPAFVRKTLWPIVIPNRLEVINIIIQC